MVIRTSDRLCIFLFFILFYGYIVSLSSYQSCRAKLKRSAAEKIISPLLLFVLFFSKLSTNDRLRRKEKVGLSSRRQSWHSQGQNVFSPGPVRTYRSFSGDLLSNLSKLQDKWLDAERIFDFRTVGQH